MNEKQLSGGNRFLSETDSVKMEDAGLEIMDMTADLYKKTGTYLMMYSLMIVLIFYAIRKKTSSPPKSKIIKFLQTGVLILFGTFNILLFLLQQYIISNI